MNMGHSSFQDEEFEEEAGGSNRLFGFMFGNVDNSGDLDADYLDPDAKEHLAAVADKFGPSLTDIDVGLANILERIVDTLRDNTTVSYLFLKPVTKKEAPDYLDIIEHPMDLSTIRNKVRRMEYRDREDFRHDVWQIAYNAHKYNDGRNPSIPPLADQLLELCDFLLHENSDILAEAEAGIGED